MIEVCKSHSQSLAQTGTDVARLTHIGESPVPVISKKII